MILAVMNTIYAIADIEAWKSQDLNGVWNHDLAIPMRCSNQLSCEDTISYPQLYIYEAWFFIHHFTDI